MTPSSRKTKTKRTFFLFIVNIGIIAGILICVIGVIAIRNNQPLKLTIEPTKQAYKDSEYITLKAVFANVSKKPYPNPIGTCAGYGFSGSMHINGLQITQDKKKISNTLDIACGTGNYLRPGEKSEQLFRINPLGLEPGTYSLQYSNSYSDYKNTKTMSRNKFVSNVAWINLARDKEAVDCYSFTDYENTKCSQIRVFSMVRTYTKALSVHRCKLIRDYYLNDEQMKPISSLSTGRCNKHEQPKFVFNVPRGDAGKVLSRLNERLSTSNVVRVAEGSDRDYREPIYSSDWQYKINNK